MEKASILHGGMINQTVRAWQSTNCYLTSDNIMYPVFIIEQDDKVQPISTMPGINRYGVNSLQNHLRPLIKKGLKSILIFGVIETLRKDEYGLNADSSENPVIKALPKLKRWFPDLTIACDVCLCVYTDHGHCGIMNTDGTVNNSESLKRISEIALNYAKAGAHIVAPSDMMDGRVGAIKQKLIDNGLANKTAILSYSVKLASGFYGPFRDAANSKPAFGDRKNYQLPPLSKGLSLRAAARDVNEGADMLMVKPALAYLDLVNETKNAHPHHPLFVYQVSGEYLMLYHAAKQRALDLIQALDEILMSMRRAGADVIITYFAPIILEHLLAWKSKI